MESTLRSLADSYTNGILSLFFPCECPVCKRYIKDFKYLYVCPACYETARFEGPYKCARCEKPLDSPHVTECTECASRENYFETVTAGGYYEGALKELIHALKFYRKKSASKIIARHVLERAGSGVFEGVDLIVPVPLGKNTLLERGYNQTEALAKIIGRKYGIPVKGSLLKVKETAPQRMLERHERLTNMRGAFSAGGGVEGLSVLVIDDVYTTGATMNEAAKILRKAGAKTVKGLVAARSI